MAEEGSVIGLSQRMDAFSFGSLNEALNELDSLYHTVPTSKTEADVNGLLKMRGSKSPLCSRRHLSHNCLTKENVTSVLPTLPSDYEHGRICSKILQSRAHRARTCPYFARKPLYSLGDRSLGRIEGLSNRVGSFPITNGDYYLRSLHSVNSLPRLFESEVKGTRAFFPQMNFQPSSFLFDDNLNRKTQDYCSYPLPVPVLTRSKSLEDLRESVKPKIKSLSSDMSSSSSMSVSLSPLRTCYGRNYTYANPTTFPMPQHKRMFENGTNPLITCKEIDSVSQLIGKLGVS